MGHGATEEQLLRTYFQQIRTITEMACPLGNAQYGMGYHKGGTAHNL